jgi:NAD(P)-dependent dehydrogenase (short-subunit alcohol dehydrogenase family)
MSAAIPAEEGRGRLERRVAVVTGASQGLGEAIARRLGEEGAAVALVARSVAKVAALATELGGSSAAVPCDVSDPDGVRAAFAQIASLYGRVDILVNNAGIIGMSLLEEAGDEAIVQQVATNLLGPIWCSRAAIPLMREAGGGDIINISSRSVELARPSLSVYSATKGGLETFSRTLAAELRPLRIRVSSIRVGPVATGPAVQAGDRGSQAVVEDWVARGGPAPEPPASAESVADAVVLIAATRPDARIPVVHLEPR